VFVLLRPESVLFAPRPRGLEKALLMLLTTEIVRGNGLLMLWDARKALRFVGFPASLQSLA
jgi:hypothetical protein